MQDDIPRTALFTRIVYLNRIMPYITDSARDMMQLRIVNRTFCEAIECYSGEVWSNYARKIIADPFCSDALLLRHVVHTGGATWLLSICVHIAGMDLNTTPIGPFTPIASAALHGAAPAVDALIQLGADVERTVCKVAGSKKNKKSETSSKNNNDDDDDEGDKKKKPKRKKARDLFASSSSSGDDDDNQDEDDDDEKEKSDKNKLKPTPEEIVAAAAFGSPLCLAAERAHDAVVKLLLDAGADTDAADSRARTALHLAADRGDIKTCQTLLAGGADITMTDSFGQTPFHLACASGNLGLVKLFVKSGAWKNEMDKNGMTGLHLAVQGGHINVVEFLADQNDGSGGGCDVNAGEAGKHHRPLHYACFANNPELVYLLLSFGADVNSRGFRNATPLIACAGRGATAAAKVLLGYAGCDKEALDAGGNSALAEAINSKDVNMVKLLIEKGCATNSWRHESFRDLHSLMQSKWKSAGTLASEFTGADKVVANEMLQKIKPRPRTPNRVRNEREAKLEQAIHARDEERDRVLAVKEAEKKFERHLQRFAELHAQLEVNKVRREEYHWVGVATARELLHARAVKAKAVEVFDRWVEEATAASNATSATTTSGAAAAADDGTKSSRKTGWSEPMLNLMEKFLPLVIADDIIPICEAATDKDLVHAVVTMPAKLRGIVEDDVTVDGLRFLFKQVREILMQLRSGKLDQILADAAATVASVTVADSSRGNNSNSGNDGKKKQKKKAAPLAAASVATKADGAKTNQAKAPPKSINASDDKPADGGDVVAAAPAGAAAKNDDDDDGDKKSESDNEDEDDDEEEKKVDDDENDASKTTTATTSASSLHPRPGRQVEEMLWTTLPEKLFSSLVKENELANAVAMRLRCLAELLRELREGEWDASLVATPSTASITATSTSAAAAPPAAASSGNSEQEQKQDDDGEVEQQPPQAAPATASSAPPPPPHRAPEADSRATVTKQNEERDDKNCVIQ